MAFHSKVTPILYAVTPWLILLFVIVIAAWHNEDCSEFSTESSCPQSRCTWADGSQCKDEKGQHVKLDAFFTDLDGSFRTIGPIFPLLLVVIQTLLLPIPRLVKVSNIFIDKGPFFCMPADKIDWWAGVMLLLCVGIWFGRLVVYIAIMRKVNDHASDHVFLATSMIAQIQIVMNVVGHSLHQEKGRLKSRLILAIAVILLVLIYFETFATAKYYHTVSADYVGFAVGLVLFGSSSFWWTWYLREGCRHLQEFNVVVGMRNGTVTEEMLKRDFEQCGEIEDLDFGRKFLNISLIRFKHKAAVEKAERKAGDYKDMQHWRCNGNETHVPLLA